MQDGDIIVAQPPAFAQRLAATSRVEQLRIYAALHVHQPLEAAALEPTLLVQAGHEGQDGPVMKPAQVKA